MADEEKPRRPGVFASQAPDFAVVAIVCSAGGRLPLLGILEQLPPDFPAAVIVLQHQAPEAPPTLLSRLLEHHSSLPLLLAADRTVLRPGVVFVAPPGRHILVTTDIRIALIEAGAIPPARPSADLLLTSLALAMGTRGVGVILSGAGRDGATGATALHHFGGIVVASDEATSEHFGMPSEAIARDDVVDYVVPADRIVDVLCSVVHGQVEAVRAAQVSDKAPDSDGAESAVVAAT